MPLTTTKMKKRMTRGKTDPLIPWLHERCQLHCDVGADKTFVMSLASIHVKRSNYCFFTLRNKKRTSFYFVLKIYIE
ncbi:unnamed protein product [Ixodes persulcatus]